mmetsp:Transcript_46301/g.121469  ORF Transcript_46301/g.121469 Transcript_46301/m.121469 type:complete len:216 (+) Transcript_46301:198-845(+)
MPPPMPPIIMPPPMPMPPPGSLCAKRHESPRMHCPFCQSKQTRWPPPPPPPKPPPPKPPPKPPPPPSPSCEKRQAAPRVHWPFCQSKQMPRPLPPPKPPPPYRSTVVPPVTCSARSFPLRSSKILTYSTTVPGSRLLPSSMLEKWQKRSSPPSLGVMKPKPRSVHRLTVPCSRPLAGGGIGLAAGGASAAAAGSIIIAGGACSSIICPDLVGAGG